jgi:hypothetical protein
MSICCERCVLVGRGLYDELITRPDESYWLWYIVLCDLGTRKWGSPDPLRGEVGGGCCARNKHTWFVSRNLH